MPAALPKPKPKGSAVGSWIITFADLMSLLLTFFILLLSFSEMDIAKYEVMARSLASSFGVSFIQGEGQPGGSIIFAEQPPPPKKSEIEQLEALEKEFEALLAECYQSRWRRRRSRPRHARNQRRS